MAKSDPGSARLADPAEHFPYKRDDALEVLDGDGGDQYTSAEIVDATAAYVDAQAAYLENPDDDTAEAYRTAADDLVLARQFHRAGRQGLQVRADNPQED